ncbi:MAG: M20/M25/M40 family metallo-hydrolase, partial [Candidatus Nitrosopolaris sp.]
MRTHHVVYSSDKKEGNRSLIPSKKEKNQRTDDHYRFVCSLLNLVSKDNVETWVNCLSSFHTRHTKSKLINDVPDWLKNVLQNFGYTDIYFHNYDKSGYELKNVICHKQGEGEKIILLCAHFDCIMEDINNFKDRAPGADDNASGVCAVLEIARILCQLKLAYSIQYVFFSGEEQGQWGSKSYARYVKDNNVNLYRLINLDMVGRPESENRIIIERDLGNVVSDNDADSQRFGETLEQAAVDYTNMQVLLGPIYDSDYMPFEAEGYVVAGFYDGGQIYDTNHS